MLGLAIEFLTGRYVATAHNNWREPEWPPHPARVFSALVATHFEDGEADPRERAALEWLEALPPPAVHCGAADAREIYDVFVPVNDMSLVTDFTDDIDALDAARAEVGAAGDDAKLSAKAAKQVAKLEAKLKTKVAKAIAPFDGKIPAEAMRVGKSTLPDQRVKQARTFPSVTPVEPRVTLMWPDAPGAEHHRDVLDALAARVVRVGHSSSLVAMRVVDDTPMAVGYAPDVDGQYVLRGVEAGQLARLCDDFAGHRGLTSGRTMPAAVHTYAVPRPSRPMVATSVFGDDWVVLVRAAAPADTADSTAVSRIDSTRTVEVARAVRYALQSHSPSQPPPEFLSGHQPDGAPSERPHVAIVPLPVVGHSHADGHLVGVALVFPRDASPDDRRAVLRAVAAWERSDKAKRTASGARVPIYFSGGLELWVERTLEPTLAAAQPTRWCRPSRVWATATPIALDRHPGDLRSRAPAEAAKAAAHAEETIAVACQRIGLPPPMVAVYPAAPLAGASKATHFPVYPPVAGRTQRALTHAVLTFDEPVIGPLLVGAGRYHGLGLLRPMLESDQ